MSTNKLKFIYDEGELRLVDNVDGQLLSLIVEAIRLEGDVDAVQSFDTVMDRISQAETDIGSIQTDVSDLDTRVTDIENDFTADGLANDNSTPDPGEVKTEFVQRQTDNNGNVTQEAKVIMRWNDGSGIFEKEFQAGTRVGDA